MAAQTAAAPAEARGAHAAAAQAEADDAAAAGPMLLSATRASSLLGTGSLDIGAWLAAAGAHGSDGGDRDDAAAALLATADALFGADSFGLLDCLNLPATPLPGDAAPADAAVIDLGGLLAPLAPPAPPHLDPHGPPTPPASERTAGDSGDLRAAYLNAVLPLDGPPAPDPRPAPPIPAWHSPALSAAASPPPPGAGTLAPAALFAPLFPAQLPAASPKRARRTPPADPSSPGSDSTLSLAADRASFFVADNAGNLTTISFPRTAFLPLSGAAGQPAKRRRVSEPDVPGHLELDLSFDTLFGRRGTGSPSATRSPPASPRRASFSALGERMRGLNVRDVAAMRAQAIRSAVGAL